MSPVFYQKDRICDWQLLPSLGKQRRFPPRMLLQLSSSLPTPAPKRAVQSHAGHGFTGQGRLPVRREKGAQSRRLADKQWHGYWG